MILVNVPIESLARALSVSRCCHQVILGSLELRRNFFLDPSPATEFCERNMAIRTSGIRSQAELYACIEGSRILHTLQ